MTIQGVVGLYLLSQTLTNNILDFESLLNFITNNKFLYTGLKCYFRYRGELVEKKEMFLDLTHIWNTDDLNREVWDYLFVNCLGYCTHFELIF